MTLKHFEQPALAERVIRTLLNSPSFLVPKVFGTSTPLTTVIDSGNIQPLIDCWLPSRKKAPPGPVKIPDGLLLMDFAPQGGYLVHWRKLTVPSFAGLSGTVPWPILDADPFRFDQLVALTKELITLVNPVYGDIQNMNLSGWDTPLDLQKRLPDVPWLSIYGEPYIKLFGEERILSAPFYKIGRLSSGHFWLQATESIRHPVPNEVRSAIRTHLGEESFMAHPKWRYRDGKAPDFDFSNVLR